MFKKNICVCNYLYKINYLQFYVVSFASASNSICESFMMKVRHKLNLFKTNC